LVSALRLCFSTPVALLKDSLAKNNVTTLKHPPYSPDLAPADFLPVTSTDISPEVTIVCDITDNIKNATEELKRISQNGFQECFQHIYSRWQKCAVAYGDCSAGNVA